ncbi:MAG: DUF3237 domain-containing protein [Actinobacteria bacterium]|nr:DUF3237 domain-containing protein [Actinomycetota bacterium]
MTIELVPLMTATINLREPIMLPNTPSGTRLIIEVASATFEGDRIRGKQKGVAAADWLTVGPEGTGTLDVRATLETDDGALIYSCYRGRLDVSQPVGSAPIYAAPLYETGDERYAWINKIQAVGKGTTDGQLLEYEIYELR